MIGKNIPAGYVELPHTADWALKVWAVSPAQLFEQAAAGMYALMEVRLGPASGQLKNLTLDAADLESLLVNFLGELLYISETERVAFSQVKVRLEGTHLQAELQTAPLEVQRKEIKAVTFHNLAIAITRERCEVTIVFDV